MATVRAFEIIVDCTNEAEKTKILDGLVAGQLPYVNSYSVDGLAIRISYGPLSVPV